MEGAYQTALTAYNAAAASQLFIYQALGCGSDALRFVRSVVLMYVSLRSSSPDTQCVVDTLAIQILVSASSIGLSFVAIPLRTVILRCSNAHAAS